MADFVKGSENPGQVLCGSHQADIMGAFLLEPEEDIRQLARGQFFSEIFLADCVVLAKTAAQGATGKKHGAASPLPADARFFPMVQRCPCCPYLVRTSAEAQTFGAVRKAFPGAKLASFHGRGAKNICR